MSIEFRQIGGSLVIVLILRTEKYRAANNYALIRDDDTYQQELAAVPR